MAITNMFVLVLGGALVLSPVILHLLMQPKPKPIAFPALKFLRQSASTNRSQLRLRQFLLLLLRCLVVLLPAAALAGPAVAAAKFGDWVWLGAIGGLLGIVSLVLLAVVLQKSRSSLLLSILALVWLGLAGWLGWNLRQVMLAGENAALGQAEAPVSAVVVLDTAPRMSYRRDNLTNLERAQELATWTVGQLPDESQIAVVETRDDDPFFSVDSAAAKKRISTFETCFTPLPIPEVLKRSLELLRDAKHERREVYVFTDLSRASWASQQSEELKAELSKLPGGALFIVDVGSTQIVNLSIASPQLKSGVLPLNSPLRISVDLARIGPAVERTVQLEIEKPDEALPTIRDGKTIVPTQVWQLTQNVQVPENGAASVAFEFSEPLPKGVHHGRLIVTGSDGLTWDNERYFTIEVRDSWKVLLVHAGNVSVTDIQEIISPTSGPKSTFDCTAIEQSELGQVDLTQYQVIMLLNPTPVEDASWKELRAFVEDGGGLCITLGQNAMRGAILDERFSTEVAQAVIGGKLTFPWVRREGDVFLRPNGLGHSLFQAFRPIETSLNWSAFPVYQHWGFELLEKTQDALQILASYNNQQPALIEHVMGKGRVLLLTTPLSEPRSPSSRRPWNDLFVGRPLPAWLLTREMVSYLAQIESDTLNVNAGQLVTLNNDLQSFPEVYSLFSPKLEQSTTKLTSVADQIRYRFADRPGHFRMKGVLEGPVTRGFSVNLTAAATDLTRIDPALLDQVCGEGNYRLATDRQQIQRQQGTARKGREFYPLLVSMLLVIFGVEYLFSNRFYRT